MLAALGVEFLATVPLGLLGREDGNELVPAFADLTSRLLEADVVAKLYHGFVPRDRVQVNGTRQRPVQVEDCGAWQISLHLNAGYGGRTWFQDASSDKTDIGPIIAVPSLAT